MTELFRPKPWEFKGRRMERNAPSGTLCSVSPWCTSPRTIGFHCTVCHETFGGLRGFDTHRKDGWCLNPATLDMELSESKVWIRALQQDAPFRRRRKPVEPRNP